MPAVFVKPGRVLLLLLNVFDDAPEVGV